MDQAELLKILRQLTPRDLRVITYTHSCTQTTTLYTCCDVSRCQACHITHLKESHDIAAQHAFQKFARAGTLTWSGYVEPTKVNKKSKSRTRAVSSKPVRRSLREEFADLTDAQVDELQALLYARRAQ